MFIIQTASGEESSPLTAAEIRMMIKEGSILPGAKARKQTESEWKKLYSYAEFFAVVADNAQPPPGSYSAPPFANPRLTRVKNPKEDAGTFVCIDDLGCLAGPYNVGELKQMLREGVVRHHTRVARKGKNEWCELGSLPEFFGVAVSHSRPPIKSHSPVVSITPKSFPRNP